MNIEALVALAADRQASDLHLEVSLRPTLRIQGELTAVGEGMTREVLTEMVRQVVGPHWEEFVTRRSFDRAMTIAGVRCRVNALHTMRGPGLAIRLLPAVTPTLDGLNLHPDLGRLMAHQHGLILVSGATGSGKSSTLAALLHEINANQARHILTIEQPIEYRLKPLRSFIRQREVGADTPSFEQALIDALREDPDVIMVGEMRDPDCMRLTLNAAETGHLVLATLHSATVAEALQRVVLAFSPEIQRGIAAQLADALKAVVCQRLRYLPKAGVRVPECEILVPGSAARAVIRQGEFSKLVSVLETGATEGSYTFDRYRRWVESQTHWRTPMVRQEGAGGDEPEPAHRRQAPPPAPSRPAAATPSPPRQPKPDAAPPPAPKPPADGSVFEIDADNTDLQSLLDELKRRD